jgi:hypothetical protein
LPHFIGDRNAKQLACQRDRHASYRASRYGRFCR